MGSDFSRGLSEWPGMKPAFCWPLCSTIEKGDTPDGPAMLYGEGECPGMGTRQDWFQCLLHSPPWLCDLVQVSTLKALVSSSIRGGDSICAAITLTWLLRTTVKTEMLYKNKRCHCYHRTVSACNPFHLTHPFLPTLAHSEEETSRGKDHARVWEAAGSGQRWTC